MKTKTTGKTLRSTTAKFLYDRYIGLETMRNAPTCTNNKNSTLK